VGAGNSKKLPDWSSSPAARYLMLVAVTVLVGIGLIMAFSASSNDAVIRLVQREFAAQRQAYEMTQDWEAQTPEERIENELDYYSALDEVLGAASAETDYESDPGVDPRAVGQPEVVPTGQDESAGIAGFISLIFGSAYAAGFRHLLFALAGAAIAFVIARCDYRKIAPLAIPVSAMLLLSLLFLLLFGRPILGSARWIDFGIFSLQPSEFAKPILLVLVAYYCSWTKDVDDAGPARQETQAALPIYARDWIMPAILIAGCLLAILLSPDVGTALIIGVGLFTAYLLSGWPWVRLAAGMGLVGAAFMVRVFLMDGGYQQRRIFEFITKWTEGITPHQTWQAELALGSGGILGLGPGLSRQKFRYLPEAHNDFIIAILGEELGLIGVALVLIAFAIILFGGLHIAARAQDRLGTAIAGGATVLIIFQALLNIFAVVSLGPVTGKPLPFITLGGSSMVSTFMLIGLIFSVARYGQVSPTKVRSRDPSAKRSRLGGTQNDDDCDRKAGRDDSARRRNRGRKRRKSDSARKRQMPREEERDDAEDDIEWRWDSGTHLSSSRPRR